MMHGLWHWRLTSQKVFKLAPISYHLRPNNSSSFHFIPFHIRYYVVEEGFFIHVREKSKGIYIPLTSITTGCGSYEKPDKTTLLINGSMWS